VTTPTRRPGAIALALPGILLAGSLALHVHHLLTGWQEFWIGVSVLMALFCLASSRLLLGWPATLAFLVTGVTLGLLFEALSVKTGFPFGPYYYTDVFGPGVMGVPFIIPLAWYVIVYLGYSLANLMIAHRPVVTGGAGRAAWLALVGALIVTAYDLALDPFMVRKVGAWVMINPGDYFGEQLRGFAGWTLVSFLIGFIVRLSHRRLPPAGHQPAPLVAVLYPVAAYGGWWVFFTLAGYPFGTRVVAAYAMGIPVLAALSGIWQWRAAQRATPATAVERV
jgi:uncharacterized membrane protein